MFCMVSDLALADSSNGGQTAPISTAPETGPTLQKPDDQQHQTTVFHGTPEPASEAQVAKAREAQKRCDPVIIYTDAGRIEHPADGCTK